jgi:hypothetical protein
MLGDSLTSELYQIFRCGVQRTGRAAYPDGLGSVYNEHYSESGGRDATYRNYTVQRVCYSSRGRGHGNESILIAGRAVFPKQATPPMPPACSCPNRVMKIYTEAYELAFTDGRAPATISFRHLFPYTLDEDARSKCKERSVDAKSAIELLSPDLLLLNLPGTHYRTEAKSGDKARADLEDLVRQTEAWLGAREANTKTAAALVDILPQHFASNQLGEYGGKDHDCGPVAESNMERANWRNAAFDSSVIGSTIQRIRLADAFFPLFGAHVSSLKDCTHYKLSPAMFMPYFSRLWSMVDGL